MVCAAVIYWLVACMQVCILKLIRKLFVEYLVFNLEFLFSVLLLVVCLHPIPSNLRNAITKHRASYILINYSICTQFFFIGHFCIIIYYCNRRLNIFIYLIYATIYIFFLHTTLIFW